MRWVLTKDETWAAVTSPKPEPVTADWISKNETAMTRLMLSVDEKPLRAVDKNQQIIPEAADVGDAIHIRHIATAHHRMQDMARRVRAAGAPIDLDEEIPALFFSLPASYDNVVSGLESRDEDTLTMELVVGKLLDEYTRRVESRTSEGNEDAMFAKPWRQPGQAHQGYGKGNNGGGSSNHKGSNSASSSTKTYKSEKACYYCKKKGHFKAECRKRQKDLASSGGKSKEAASKAAGNRRGDRGGDHSFVIVERASIVSVANTSNEWLVDSGCTSHMTSNRNLFSELKTTKRVVQLAGRDHSIPVTGIGTVRFRCNTPDGTEFNASLKEVLYVPELESSLISVSKLLSKECKVIFEDKGCNIERGGEVYLHAKEHNGLYKLEWLGKATQTPGKYERESASVERSNHVTIDDWHRRFGHRDSAAIQLLHRDNLVHGVDLVAGDKPSKECEVCIIADSVRIIESPTKLMPMEATSTQVDISVGEEQSDNRSEITEGDFEMETAPDEQQPDTPTATPVNGDEPIQQRRGRGRPRKVQGDPQLVPADQTPPEGGDEMTQQLPEIADFERADVFITPPDDGAGSEEDSGDEDDIGDINNLSGRQLRAQATAKLSFKNDLTNIGEDSDEECDIPLSELRKELLLMSSKRNWPKTDLQPNFPPFVNPKVQQTIPSDPVACFELFFDAEVYANSCCLVIPREELSSSTRSRKLDSPDSPSYFTFHLCTENEDLSVYIRLEGSPKLREILSRAAARRASILSAAVITDAAS
ncbi:hypothetical protein CBL_07165 [Carabus blaptoides fortunei]